jgi:hypothetical protein
MTVWMFLNLYQLNTFVRMISSQLRPPVCSQLRPTLAMYHGTYRLAKMNAVAVHTVQKIQRKIVGTKL